MGSPSLLLLPTELEARRFADLGGLEPGHALAHLCGFGPVAAAARTAQLLGTVRPARVLLTGIAGSFDPGRAPIGEAVVFTRVALEGVGVGEGQDFQGPPALGFPQWPGSADTPVIQEELPLACPAGTDPALLLTTCAASASPEHAGQRHVRFDEALAEDMEGFGVALACALFGVPLAIVRGISNEVGDRTPGNWRIPGALAAARRAAARVLETPWE
jgi:futalosine hydrolase